MWFKHALFSFLQVTTAEEGHLSHQWVLQTGTKRSYLALKRSPWEFLLFMAVRAKCRFPFVQAPCRNSKFPHCFPFYNIVAEMNSQPL